MNQYSVEEGRQEMQTMMSAAQKQKRAWWKSKPALGAASLLLGIGIGVVGAEGDPEASPAFIALQSKHDEAAAELDVVSDERDDLAAQVIDLEEILEAQQAETKTLEKDVETMAKREEELVEREEELSELQEELTVREASLKEEEAAASKVAPLVSTTSGGASAGNSGASKPAPAPTTAPTPAPKEPSKDVYYKNCTAAREAGVTPIYRGEPGYAKHLDRDGDGVACE